MPTKSSEQKLPDTDKSSARIRGALALVGGEEFSESLDEVCSFDKELIETSIQSKGQQPNENQAVSVLIVPTAAAYENPAKKIQQGRDYFSNDAFLKLGVEVEALEIYTRMEAMEFPEAELNEKLEHANIIYLTGGSPMHLRSVLMRSLIFEAIKTAWQNGAVLVGAGAGGDVLCDYMVDARGGAFTVGLNLISEISVIPRYNHWSEDKIQRTVKLAPPDIFVAGVPTQTALISEAGKPWRQMGIGEVDVFRGGKKLAVKDLPIL